MPNERNGIRRRNGRRRGPKEEQEEKRGPRRRHFGNSTVISTCNFGADKEKEKKKTER